MPKCKITIPDNAEELTMLHNADVLAGIEASRSDYRKLVRALIAQGVQGIKNGKMQINSVDDLERLIKLDLALQRENLLL